MTVAKRSFHCVASFDGSGDTRYETGNKPQVSQGTLDIDRAAYAAARLSLLGLPANVPFSENFRQYLTGTSAASAVISVQATAGDLGTWTTDTDNLVNTFAAAALGNFSLQVRATDGTTTVLFPVEPWSFLTSTQTRKKKAIFGIGAQTTQILSAGSKAATVTSDIGQLVGHPGFVDFKLMVTWAHIDKGFVNFTGSATGQTSIGLASTLPNGTYVFKMSSGAFRVVTVVGGEASWSGALTGTPNNSAHVYDFQQIDAVETLLVNQSDARRALSLVVLPGSFGSTHAGTTDYSVIPQYIQQNSACGQATYYVGGVLNSPAAQYGWSGGDVTKTYTAHLYNSVVAEYWTQLHETIAWYKDNDPNFAWICHQETAWVINGSSNNKDPGYSGSGFYNNAIIWLTRCAAAFQKTPIQYQNTWTDSPKYTVPLEAKMISLGVVPGAADTYGIKKINANGGSRMSDGLNAWAGVTVGGFTSPDSSNIIGTAMDVEGPDEEGFGSGTRFSVSNDDLRQGLVGPYKAMKAWITILYQNASSPIPTFSVFAGAGGAGAYWDANPLTNIGYPVNCPGWT